jgi:hypothetical protein
MQRINETKIWFFEKINKINKNLVNLTKMRSEKTKINNIRNEKGGDNSKNQGKPRNYQGLL